MFSFALVPMMRDDGEKKMRLARSILYSFKDSFSHLVKKKQYSSNFQSVDVGQETRVTSETLNVTIDVVSVVVLFG